MFIFGGVRKSSQWPKIFVEPVKT